MEEEWERIVIQQAKISPISQLYYVLDELKKILSSDKPSIGFLHLYQTGLLDLILPELTALNNVEEVEGHTHKNNFFSTFKNKFFSGFVFIWNFTF